MHPLNWAFPFLLGAPTTISAPLPDPTAILGGEVVEPGELDTVVGVVHANSLCTGLVVSSRIVVTAAHCLIDASLGDTVSVLYGEELQQHQPVDAIAFGTHPDFCRDCAEDIYDYGFVEMEADFVPPSGAFFAPVADQADWDESMVQGRDVTVVGFGADPGAGGIGDGTGTKRKVDVPIEHFSDLGLEFFAGGDDRDSCPGDSGGPAFTRLDDGRLLFAGVTSRGSDPCGSGGYYGAAFPALCWLRDETGVDLLDGTCCDCVDMSPPPEGHGCAVATARPRDMMAIAFLLVLGPGKRSRRARR